MKAWIIWENVGAGERVVAQAKHVDFRYPSYAYVFEVRSRSDALGGPVWSLMTPARETELCRELLDEHFKELAIAAEMRFADAKPADDGSKREVDRIYR